MKIFIFSKQIEIAQIISEHFTEKGHLCFAFPKLEQLREIIEINRGQPDLLILDYQTYNHDIFNIYNYFERHMYNIPIVFYNEPCLLKPRRSEHWLEQIKYKQSYYLRIKIDLYKPILEALEKLIESPRLKPYISLINDPLQFPKELIHDSLTLHYLEEINNDCIFEFKDQTKLSKSLFYLLEILQKNQSNPMSLEEIIAVYKKDKKQMTIESLKVLMSRLRKKIRQNPDCGFLINSSNKKYRFVHYKVSTKKDD